MVRLAEKGNTFVFSRFITPSHIKKVQITITYVWNFKQQYIICHIFVMKYMGVDEKETLGSSFLIFSSHSVCSSPISVYSSLPGSKIIQNNFLDVDSKLENCVHSPKTPKIETNPTLKANIVIKQEPITVMRNQCKQLRSEWKETLANMRQPKHYLDICIAFNRSIVQSMYQFCITYQIKYPKICF